MNDFYQTVIIGLVIVLIGYQTYVQNEAIRCMYDMNNKLHMTFIRS